MHAQPFRGDRDLAFCLKVPLDSLLVWASSEGSGETARMRSLAWTFAARIGDKYQIRLTRSIWRSLVKLHVIVAKLSDVYANELRPLFVFYIFTDDKERDITLLLRMQHYRPSNQYETMSLTNVRRSANADKDLVVKTLILFTLNQRNHLLKQTLIILAIQTKRSNLVKPAITTTEKFISNKQKQHRKVENKKSL